MLTLISLIFRRRRVRLEPIEASLALALTARKVTLITLLCHRFNLLSVLLVPVGPTVKLAQESAHRVSQVFTSQMKAKPFVIRAQRATFASKAARRIQNATKDFSATLGQIHAQTATLDTMQMTKACQHA